MMEDPETLQQISQMIRNPSLMREMQRNQDRLIGSLDVMPGGHNALVQAHQDIADPLMHALSGSGGEASQTNFTEYGSQTDGAPNTDALPNPWGGPSSTVGGSAAP